MALMEWDHTVHYVNDLEKAVQTFKDNGLHAIHGGSHKQWGTFNALSYFGLNYIEFMGVEDWEAARNPEAENLIAQDAVKNLPEEEVLSRVAIRTDHIETIRTSLLDHGLSVSPVLNGKRLNGHGRLIEWKMVTVKGDYKGLLYPFFIQWKELDHERQALLKKEGVIKDHPAGKVQLDEAVFLVDNPGAAADHWQTLFGLQRSDQHDHALKIGECAFVFKEGKNNENTLSQLVFTTNSSNLKEKTITIGKGQYVFR
ncbi:hypothetical protein CR205_13460 [Alteribacter lacisalsi]|uniref:Glyoxalase-like domain-containing protein n=1 Tax=Alteribacter lacisalsi TaxID=2045244 RepID=A0A2W0HIR9_9BACI|nr:VOC family protein [Alteribacter lacisalsi]PYZ96699.1 hypothetical protein CR205_13460 [Alteribacter lacisalsi]